MVRAQTTRPRRSPQNLTENPPPLPPALTELILVRCSQCRGPTTTTPLYRGHFRLVFYRGEWYAVPLCPIYPILGDDNDYSGSCGPPSVDS